jgi:hypothetical protein
VRHVIITASGVQGRERPGAAAEPRRIPGHWAADRTDVCPERPISIGVDVPSSALWISAESRSWCRAAPPDAA